MFNADLFGAEHLMIEDEAPDTSFQARKRFGSAIKQFTVNRSQRLHAKGRDAVTLEPLWRISITLNDEPEDLHVLPPMDSGIEDKIILLQAYKREFPMPTDTGKQMEQFWQQLVSELPAFVYYLLNKFEIPQELVSSRFGIKHFHHPRILAAISELSPEERMLDLIDSHLIRYLPRRFTSSQLEKLLREKVDHYLVDQILRFGHASGTFLGRVSKSHPYRVINTRTSGTRQWLINLPNEANEQETKLTDGSF